MFSSRILAMFCYVIFTKTKSTTLAVHCQLLQHEMTITGISTINIAYRIALHVVVRDMFASRYICVIKQVYSKVDLPSI